MFVLSYFATYNIHLFYRIDRVGQNRTWDFHILYIRRI